MSESAATARSAFVRRFERVAGAIARIADQLSAFVCAFLIVVTTISMVIYQAGIAIPWLDDVLRMQLIWLVYLGTVSLSLHNDHIAMDAVYQRMPPGMRHAIDIFVALLGLFLCMFVAKIGFDSLSQTIEFDEQLPSGYLSAWPQALAIPFCFLLMTIAYLGHLIRVITRTHQRPAATS